MKVVEGLRNYEERGMFEPWLFKIAATRLTEHYKERNRIDDTKDITGRMAGSTIGETAHRELLDDIIQVYTTLSQEDQEVIALRFFEELTIEETAEALEISYTAAKSRISRAMGRMKLLLKGRGYEISDRMYTRNS